MRLNITATAYVWTGLDSGNWDTTTPNNWMQSGSAAIFANGAPALIDDTGSAQTMTLNGVVQPTSTTVNNSAIHSYSIVSSAGKDIGGSGGLTKSGNGILDACTAAPTPTPASRPSAAAR